jgi:hypothetical protein
MAITASMEIHFYEQDELAVFFESNAPSELEKLAEIGLFTMFAIRIMSNLGVHEITDGLGSFLIEAETFAPRFLDVLRDRGFRLVRYPGHAGRKQFLGSVTMEKIVRFDHKMKGFGWLGRGLGYYAPIAVMALLRFLVERHENDLEFHQRLAKAAWACGRFQLERRIGLTNQVELGTGVIAFAAEPYIPKPSSE